MAVTTELPVSADVEIVSDEVLWRGRTALQLVKFRQRRFDGAMSGVRTWELWRRGRAAAVLPYDPVADCVVMIEQFRLPAFAAGLDPVLLELPAGLADGSEPSESIVRREMVEETGLSVGALVEIGNFILTPGGADETCMIYAGCVRVPIANGRIGIGGLASEQEDILVRAMPAMEAIEAVFAGRIQNSVAAIGLLWLANKREWLRDVWANQGG